MPRVREAKRVRRERLDRLLVDRGLARSRERAQREGIEIDQLVYEALAALQA